MTLTGKLDTSTFGGLPDRGRERPRQEAEAPGPEAPGPRLDRQRRHPRPAVRPPADGDLGPGRHLRGRAEAGGPRGAPARRPGPGGHQRRRELRPVPGRGPDRQEPRRTSGPRPVGAGQELAPAGVTPAGGWSSSTKPWLISTMLPSGSATQTVRQPGMNASKSIGPAVTFASAPISASLASTSSTLNARCRQPGYSGPGPDGCRRRVRLGRAEQLEVAAARTSGRRSGRPRRAARPGPDGSRSGACRTARWPPCPGRPRPCDGMRQRPRLSSV